MERVCAYSTVLSFPFGLDVAPSRPRGLPVGHGASALATLLIHIIQLYLNDNLEFSILQC